MLQIRSKKVLLFAKILILLFFVVPTQVFASTYNTDATKVSQEATNICIQYTTGNDINGTIPSPGTGSAVPISVVNLLQPLLLVAQNTRTLANEIRIQNLLNYCRSLPNMAAAQQRIENQAYLQSKTIAEACLGDVECAKARAKKRDIEQQTLLISQDTNNPYARQTAKALMEAVNPTLSLEEQKAIELAKKSAECDQEIQQLGYISRKCQQVRADGGYAENIIRKKVELASSVINKTQFELDDEAKRSGGLLAARTCSATKSGADPNQVKWTDLDCVSWKTTPVFLTQQSVSNIVRLPYDQAFSPSSALGADGTFENISTRVREGNLFDPNILNNFSSPSGQSQGSPYTTGGTAPIGGGSASDLKAVEANYNKLITNVTTIITLYEAGRLYYASSTSACAKIPAVDRSATIVKIDAAKKPYVDYKADLMAKMAAATSSPNTSHIDLITRINFDLADKINQSLISKVYDAVVKLLQACA